MAEFREWRQAYRLQTKKMAVIEKEIPKMLPFSLTTELKPSIEAWFDDQQQKTNNRFKEEAGIFNKLSSIKGGIEELRETLKFFERKDNYLLKIQNISEGIISRMDGFKGEMAGDYEKYATVEESLTRELDILGIKVEQLEKNEEVHEESHPIKSKQLVQKQNPTVEQTKNPQIKQPSSHHDINKAIVILEDDMKELTKVVESVDLETRGFGKNLGWPEDDHNDFIMLLNRRKNNNFFEFEEDCFNQLKTYTLDQIRGHFEKHKKLVSLNERRKDLLYEYKLMKEKKRELELGLIENKEKEERVRANQARREVDKAKEEKETKEKLNNWKLMKEAQKESDERERLQEEEQKRQEIQRRRREVQEKRAIVAEWKQQKEVYKQETKEIKRPRSAINKETIERIKKKEDDLLMKKMDILRNQELKEQEKARKQQLIKEKKYVEFNHVRSKLDEKTTAMKEKQRTKFDGNNPKDAETFGGNLGVMHGRAVPSWRQGL